MPPATFYKNLKNPLTIYNFLWRQGGNMILGTSPSRQAEGGKHPPIHHLVSLNFNLVVVSNMFYVHPETWRRFLPIWRSAYFSDGLVQPPISLNFERPRAFGNAKSKETRPRLFWQFRLRALFHNDNVSYIMCPEESWICMVQKKMRFNGCHHRCITLKERHSRMMSPSDS